ncbi:glycosyltransferase involved in cell wall biosynthesis [Nonlabens dokdonensis]|uniref:Glycosyltransferase n=2 Tax=Nonlabens dokdonensis TaxID=328515 RepID=L7WBD4_NONDD|nr:glycosyltransferase family 2 protein [Nonlabens dokdonensis]AGC77409.1 glycosyltransferase [Nonlabens dokdonensis DSW-6]PZX40935.1 glycosyltransferase involved in cell wall biosynthesis [Nonlabens dokdonensis]
MKISIITINYNDAAGLERTLKSVHDQNSTSFEHLIIDGNSTDGSIAIIEEYKDRVSFSVSEPDQGIYDAMNKGIHHATGDYLLFLNSGDTLLNDTVIEKAVPYLKNNIDLVYGALYIVPTQGSGFRHTYPDVLDFNFFKQTSLGHPSTFIKRELFDLYGRYRTDLKIVSDWEFFLNLICKKKVSYQKIDLTISQFYEGGISTSAETVQLNRAEINKVLLENFDLYNSSFDELIAIHKTKSMIIKKLHPNVAFVTTNSYLLKILNKFIGLLSTILRVKRS